ncbi:hypothetical protein M513_09122 [Trichuris suis]|uniref:Uncharacterized protein n=1 Tax=Trichuris suis TaxID=68888 RepID=A0A085LYI3_9BILA|nr:hypothetical protein M513_09122 [Trichuris suis]
MDEVMDTMAALAVGLMFSNSLHNGSGLDCLTVATMPEAHMIVTVHTPNRRKMLNDALGFASYLPICMAA